MEKEEKGNYYRGRMRLFREIKDSLEEYYATLRMKNQPFPLIGNLLFNIPLVQENDYVSFDLANSSCSDNGEGGIISDNKREFLSKLETEAQIPVREAIKRIQQGTETRQRDFGVRCWHNPGVNNGRNDYDVRVQKKNPRRNRKHVPN